MGAASPAGGAPSSPRRAAGDRERGVVRVVLFCGGLGLRMAETAQSIPKPMVPIGNRPILWHIMKYYAHHGHKEFILCLGHKAEVIKDFFLNYNEALSNDFVLTDGGRQVELLSSDIGEWRITFVDTGLYNNIGQRLAAVRKHLDDEDYFLATYGDAVTDAPLPELVTRLVESEKIATFLCVRPTSYSFHTVAMNEGIVTGIQDVTEAGIWINGGFFVFRNDIFDYIQDAEDLVDEPFDRLIEGGQLLAYRYEGFWAPMDTLKDKHNLEALLESGRAPWEVWEARGPSQTPV
jgi:glucose-1-phosphate cytidylyltransferase